jgi:peptidylprolyl isomerase
MTTKRRRERIEQRKRESRNTKRTLLIVGGAIVVLVIVAVIVASSGSKGTAGSTSRLPRANRVSAATLDQTAGTDPCGIFPSITGKETEPPRIAIDTSKDYSAWIVTTKGTIVLDLFGEVAPATVNNFMFLACNHFYDNLTFHRVITDFVAQGGDPQGDGSGGPLYTIPDEFKLSDLKFDTAGQLSMAHTGQPDSAGSQFFITLADNQSTQGLTGSFTIFGQVAKGMEVALALTPHEPGKDNNTPDKMTTIIIRQVSP